MSFRATEYTFTTGTVNVPSLSSSGAITSGQNFVSTANSVVLANNGSGIIYLRPMGAGSATNQTTISNAGNMTVNGSINATGGFGPTSDPRLKDSNSFRAVNGAVNILSKLNVTYGKYYDWHNSDGKERVFLMADETMKENAPQVFMEDVFIEEDGKTYAGWSADQMIALLVKSIQEMKTEIDNLKEQIK